MRLWIALHLSRLPLEVFSPSWSPDTGSVVLDHERALVASDQARAAGVRTGMRRGGVLMLLPDAQIHERSSTLEERALHAVALTLLQYTPQVTLSEESTLILDVGQSLTLFRGPRALCRRVRESVRALGYTAQLACAPTARGAWLLARAGGGRVLKQASLVRRLDCLPVLLAPPARPFASWFDGIGCTTLGELRRLPRPGLQRRCGRALLDILDAAHGTLPEMHGWYAPAPTFEARLELFDRIENAELLMAGAQHLLQQLTGWLCGRLLATERVALILEHERGREAIPGTRVDVALAEPTWRDEHLVRLLKERLGKLELKAPVIGLGLETGQLKAMAPPTTSLFPEPGGTDADRNQLLEVLVARLGEDNVLQAAPKADHRPEVANAWIPVGQKISAAERREQLPPNIEDLPRPTWLLKQPIPLLMRNHRPWYTSALRIVAGPERIEAGWWSQTEARDYYIMEDENHTLYWLFRERASLESDEEPRFHLHGLFG